VPWPPGQVPAAATHVLLLPSQQPPAKQKLPSQHGCPPPPQLTHLPAVEHERCVRVQKSPLEPLPFGLPLQQFSPVPPQVLLLQPWLWHVPREPPHCALFAMQPLASQQPLVFVQPWRWQQGCPAPPHAVTVPLSQTVVALAASPEARQLPEVQQPPPLHVLPAQHGSVELPHAAHWPLTMQIVLAAAHAAPVVTHADVPGSQQPVVHTLPGQHAEPGLPHMVHVPLTHTVPPIEHALPFATHAEVPVSQQPPAVHVLPTQHACPEPPHPTHTPPLQSVFAVEHDVLSPTHLFVPGSQHAPP
jgi:hypothetical protein